MAAPTTPVDLNINPDAILAGDVGGFVVAAPKGIPFPADATEQFDGAPGKWEAAGIIADDGITTSYKRERTTKQGWNVRGDVKSIPKAASFSAKFAAMQASALMHKLFYGAAPTALATAGHTSTKLLARSDVTEYAYGFHMPFTDGTADRYAIPRGVVEDIDDVKYSGDEVKMFGLTVKAQISPSVDYLGLLYTNVAAVVAAP